MTDTAERWDPVKVRRDVLADLSAIVELAERLPDEAASSSSDHEFPGGEALVLMTPAANLEAWEHRYESAEGNALALGLAFDTKNGGRDYAADQVAELHPLLVLATWEDVVREERDQPTDLRATIQRAADYLRHSVDWMLSTDEWGNLNFLAIDAMANELRDCKAMLENVLKAGERSDRGAPCMRCGTDLEKRWAGRGRPVSEDRWHCPKCKQWSTVDQYNKAVEAAARATAKALTATEMLEEYRIPPGSLTAWAAKGLVRKRGRNRNGRVLYDVADALQHRDGALAGDDGC